MPYNRDIRHMAPLPSGALPTEVEISDMARRDRKERMSALRGRLSQLFGH